MRSSSEDSAVRKITGSIASSACDAQLADQRPAVHLGHHHVGDQQIGRARERARERVLAIDRRLDAVAALLEHGRDHAQDPGVVVGDQDVRSHLARAEGNV